LAFCKEKTRRRQSAGPEPAPADFPPALFFGTPDLTAPIFDLCFLRDEQSAETEKLAVAAYFRIRPHGDCPHHLDGDFKLDAAWAPALAFSCADPHS
jgi:hypothetical protein